MEEKAARDHFLLNSDEHTPNEINTQVARGRIYIDDSMGWFERCATRGDYMK